MMKRIILVWMAAFLMSGMAMAQQARRNDKMPDPKVRAERMTERMTKEYSLNDAQKKQLLEANMALVEKMGDRPGHRKSNVRRGKCEKDCCCCRKAGKRAGKAGKRIQLTDEQRAERKKARDSYNAQLQKIMTSDQYAAYTKKMQEGKDKVKRSRK